MRSAKKWPWLKIIGCVVILLGFIPVARLYWHERSHSGPPLSFPLTLTRGEYASPSFTTDTKWSYFLVLEFGHLPRTFENLCQIGYYEECLGIEPVTFDWSFVDDKGTMLQQGRYKTHGQRLIWLATGHEEIWRVVIGDVDQYTKGQRRLVLRVLHDTPELDAFEPKLKVRYSISSAEGVGLESVFAVMWAFWVGAIGLVIVFGPMIWKSLCTLIPRIKPS